MPKATICIYGTSELPVLKTEILSKFVKTYIIMTAAAIRERLYDFIRVADDKKVKAIYTILEGEITETAEWWKDKTLIKEMDEEYEAWETGKEKGFTLKEIDAEYEQIKQKRKQ